MNNQDTTVQIVLAGLGLIGVPWCVWVTASIFSQKTHTALLRNEIKILERIHGYLEKFQKVAN